ncbi:coproporphyrinogen III oxidase family protein [Helicobacter sp. MIT 11-5569]|uniref:coproporphyrinogen III oxidase family protein n=1 Tax=Helicobacter sp. MIT 11-5569 TaxID=1548151 RepID=UPI00051FA0C4|nr:coproporphyrinogen III oxidase family protein [Helicobacter sp. MIT 11-5569]TLD84547.1 coproporphyrinogen III oxidase family protein [Helicobacter sp. MIT 11-5569]
MIRQNFSTLLVNSVMRYATEKYLHLQLSECTTLPKPNPKKVQDKSYLLYMHIPFCATLCTYCSFNRFLFQEDKAKLYFENLRKEMQMVKNLGYDFSEVYVGGGTTSIMPDELCKTLDLAKSLFSIQQVSCESDPNHLQREVLEQFKGRIDRLSVGVQSFDDGILKKIGRYEKFGSGEETYKKLEAAIGILPILNVDLIFNFPNQTQEMLAKDLEIIRSLKPNQLTTYPLMSSPSVKSLIKRSIGEVDLQNEARLYAQILETLSSDFIPLSSWAFSHKGSEIFDEYVVNNDEYVGIGSGSFSFIGGTLYVNTFSLKTYAQRIQSGKMGVVRERKYSKKAQLQYRLMVELFGGEANIERFWTLYGVNLEKALFKEITFLCLSGNIFKKNNAYYPTQKGKYLFLSMMKEFYIGMDRVREESRAMLKEEDM